MSEPVAYATVNKRGDIGDVSIYADTLYESEIKEGWKYVPLYPAGAFWRKDAAIAELVELLKPFAALLQPHNDRNYSGSDSTPLFSVNHAQMTLGNLRNARAAIAKYDK